ncbi:MAG: TonB-dependent receptor [Bacteroidetes bacterium]|nr:TonB-dependent receptor [Bacteroidota bacterium]
MKKILLFLFLLFFTNKILSQTSIFGKVIDADKTPIPGVIVIAHSLDSLTNLNTITDSLGKFKLQLISNKKYKLSFNYVGFKTITKNIEVAFKPLNIGTINMADGANQLKEVEVKIVQERGKQKEDTTQFNANAFKTHPDATTEDLIKKMPGITSDNNGVKVNGEQVQKVLVDGKPFFGDDPNAALKNLPAEVVDKIEVFDKLSNQAQFTGFTDDNTQKTINIVTRKDKNQGQFGKVFGGLGADYFAPNNLRYNNGFTLNSFKNKQRITLLYIGNNINQQNFSISDITGAIGNSGGQGGMGGPPGGGSGGPPGMFGGVGNLLTAPQNGITATQSGGLNYSDEWGKKTQITGSYFFNSTNNSNISTLDRNYFAQNGLIYNQSNNNSTNNLNHRINLQIEHTIDSSNKIILTPSFNYQNNLANTNMLTSNTLNGSINLSKSSTNSSITNAGYDFNNSLLYMHNFKRKGRTFSINIATLLSERNNFGTYFSLNQPGFGNPTLLNQKYTTYSHTQKINPSISYTEPIGKNSQIQLNYSPSYTKGNSDKTTNSYDSVSKIYNDFNQSLSNKYDNLYETQRGGITYRFQNKKLNFNVGSDAQQASLSGSQIYPDSFKINQSFFNVLPNARLNYKFNKSTNLRMYYRTSTTVPSLTQLQNVLDLSNPLQIKTGNPQLKQTFENNFTIRFGGFNSVTSKNIMFVLRGNYTNNYITSTNYLLRHDTFINNFKVTRGSQINSYVNLSNYYTASAFAVYGFPLKSIKSNINFNGGVSLTSSPSMINSMLNTSNNLSYNGGIFLGSNISKNIDFSIAYNAGYTEVKNTLQAQTNNNYYTHTATARLNWIFWKGIVINTDVTNTLYQGLTQNFSQNYFLWNAYIGYKFLKKQNLEAKISAYDILNQNRSIGRNIMANYTEDYKTTVLNRYFLFTLTYTLRNFKGSPPPAESDNMNRGFMPPPSGYPQGVPPMRQH